MTPIRSKHQLKRKILALRVLTLVIVIPLAIIIEVLKTVYPHHYGSLVTVPVVVAFGLAYLIHRRILRTKAELGSLV